MTELRGGSQNTAISMSLLRRYLLLLPRKSDVKSMVRARTLAPRRDLGNGRRVNGRLLSLTEFQFKETGYLRNFQRLDCAPCIRRHVLAGDFVAGRELEYSGGVQNIQGFGIKDWIWADGCDKDNTKAHFDSVLKYLHSHLRWKCPQRGCAILGLDILSLAAYSLGLSALGGNDFRVIWKQSFVGSDYQQVHSELVGEVQSCNLSKAKADRQIYQGQNVAEGVEARRGVCKIRRCLLANTVNAKYLNESHTRIWAVAKMNIFQHRSWKLSVIDSSRMEAEKYSSFWKRYKGR